MGLRESKNPFFSWKTKIVIFIFCISYELKKKNNIPKHILLDMHFLHKLRREKKIPRPG